MNAKNDNIERLKTVIRKTTGEEAKVIAVPSELIHFTGSTQKAVFLAQLVYWSDRGNRSDKFVFKSRIEWKEETGLSSDQIERYTKEFKESGFLQTKLKKAKGTPTLHYKLEFDTFLKSFEEFSAIRISEKSQNQLEKSAESLTENTTEITSDILSTQTNSDEFARDALKTEEQSRSNARYEDDDKEIVIPDDFKPTLDNQYRATIHFKAKSPNRLTSKFVAHYKRKGMKKTMADWQFKWWEWMQSETAIIGQDEVLEAEHWIIQKKALNEVFRMSYSLDRKIFLISDLCKFAESSLSSETVLHCVDWLTENRNFAFVDNKNRVFNLQEYRANADWKKATDEEARNLNIDLSALNP